MIILHKRQRNRARDKNKDFLDNHCVLNYFSEELGVSFEKFKSKKQKKEMLMEVGRKEFEYPKHALGFKSFFDN